MSQGPKSDETALLWRLAAAGGSEQLKSLKPSPKTTARKRLVAEKLIEETKRKPESGGRALSYIALTDEGWNWLSENMANPQLSTRANVVTTLELILQRISVFLEKSDLSLAELLDPTSDVDSIAPIAQPQRAILSTNGDLADQIKKAYMQISRGQENVRVRLADLREALPNLPRHDLDAALLQLDAQGKLLTLYQLDNPLEINDRDRKAMLQTPAGEPRHIIYLGGQRA